MDKTKKYFVVSQHDDAVKEYLPLDTLRFCAGGNSGGVPIPLVCSPIPQRYKDKLERDIFCSFVGSLTHPIREKMESILSNNKDYLLKVKKWSDKVDTKDLEDFIYITKRSKFVLCPRGYGKNSFRLYEAMQMGSVPVYIYDDDWRPFKDNIKWEEFSVSIHSNDLEKIDSILKSFSEQEILEMSVKCEEVYEKYFSLIKISETITTNIKNDI